MITHLISLTLVSAYYACTGASDPEGVQSASVAEGFYIGLAMFALTGIIIVVVPILICWQDRRMWEQLKSGEDNTDA